MKAQDVFSLCSWKEIKFSEAKRFKPGSFLEEVGWDEQGIDLFGRLPQTYLHEGDVTLRGPLSLQTQGQGLFIIHGSLKVEGTLAFSGRDAANFLLVTGEVEVENLIQGGDTQLGVQGSLIAQDTLWFDLAELGFVIVRQEMKARRIMVGAEGEVCCDNEPDGEMLQAPLPLSNEVSRDMTPEEKKAGLPKVEKVMATLFSGTPLFSK